MCGSSAMVIIYSKTLEKKPGLGDVKSIAKELDLELIARGSMSLQGASLFPCRVMESGARPWHDVGLGPGGCGSLRHQGPSVGSSSLENLWDVVPSEFQQHHLQSSVRWWGRDGGLSSTAAPGLGPAPGVLTGLLKDLSLGEEPVASPSTAPPPKRQCRSLSCSEDLGGCRTAWRPQGSRVWTAVEKRRCHSGGSVQRGVAMGRSGSQQLGFPAIQRSSSFSLPARSNTLSQDLPGFSSQKGVPCPFSFTCLAPSSSPVSSEPPGAFLYLSHEQICLPELQAGPVSPHSSPDSTPEMERRAGPGGLARSHSQPCVLNDQKIGMKRRRPAESNKQRPSLDLAKMTQKLQNFHSLSCPGIPRDDSCQSSQDPPPLRTTAQCETDFTAAGDQGLDDPRARTEEGGVITRVSAEEDPAILIEEPDCLSSPDCGDFTSGKANGKGREPLWAGLCSTRKDVYQLGGELDIEQIERN